MLLAPSGARVLAGLALATGSRVAWIGAALLLVLATLIDLRLRVLAPKAAALPLVRAGAILSGAVVLAGLVVGVTSGAGVMWAVIALAGEAVLVTVLAAAICAGWPVRRWSRILDRAMILRWVATAVLIALAPGVALPAVALLTVAAALGVVAIAAWEASQHDPAAAPAVAAWGRLLDAGPILRALARLFQNTLAPRTAAVITAVAVWLVFAGPLLDGTERRVRFLLAAEILVLIALGMTLRSGLAGRLSWALPVVGIVIEAVTIGRLVQTTVPGAEVAAIALVAVIVAHRAELAARTVAGPAEPPKWLRAAGLGFDGRLLAVTGSVAVLGVESAAAIWALAAYLAVAFAAGRLATGGRRQQGGASTRPADARDVPSSESSTSAAVVDLRDQQPSLPASPQARP